MFKPHLIAVFVFITFAVFIYSIFQEKSDITNIYAMALSPEIIDKDLLLIKNLEDIENLFSETNVNNEEIYEPGSMDLSKDVIVTATAKIMKKPKPKKFELIKHIVKEGESLWAISKNYNININSILNFNHNMQKNIIHSNMMLNIPNLDGFFHKVRRAENIYSIAKMYKVDLKDIIKYNDLKNPKLIKRGQNLFIPGKKLKSAIYAKKKKPTKMFTLPVLRGYISSIFGNRYHPVYRRWIFHEGLDIASSRGTKIYSSAGGKVTFVGWIRGYGKVIVLRHTKGFSTRYAHLRRAVVRIGEWVDQGQLIGYMGRTGRVTGTHLHFEIRRYGQALNPTKYIRFSKLKG